jgi:2-keto-4-pentenoate hydratase
MDLAESLWTARTSGTQIEPVSPRPSVEEAYATQRAMSVIAGSAVVGWKLGATAPAALTLLGLEEPFYGPLFERFCHRTGDEVTIVPAHGAALETEFVVGLGRDVPGRDAPYTGEEIAESVAWVCGAFEIVGTRFVGGLPGSGTLALADGGANMDFVQGMPVEDWRGIDLGGHPATLYVNGTEVASGHSGMLSFGDPIRAVAWLASQPAFRASGLAAGTMVTTGTCTGVTPIAPGDEARADFGSLGEVTARFAAA